MNFPLRRRRKVAMNCRDSVIVRSPSYMQHVRGFVCAVFDKPNHECSGRMHAHHCREGADGGTGMKPGDHTVVPLCDLAHAEIHAKGWRTFESKYGIDLSALANKLWHASKHRIAWERRNG